MAIGVGIGGTVFQSLMSLQLESIGLATGTKGHRAVRG